ncbi:MAG TPA: hypothetical protein DEQ43_05850 [Nocardioides bacterium]|nr:hypothetical protein [Nocardioides sp.]
MIRSQADLERVWRFLIRPLGFRRRSLWLLLIDVDDRPITGLTEISDLPQRPDPTMSDKLAELFRHLADIGPASRWAVLVSRPGSRPADAADRLWAAALYDAFREHAIGHDVVHLATDAEIVPIPLDDVTDYLRAS